MKKRLILILMIFLGISTNLLSYSGAFYTDSISVNQLKFGVEIPVTLEFYANDEGNAVGFELRGISKYDSLNFKMAYSHDGIDEVVESTIPLSGQDTFKEEWIILGTESNGAIVYHQGVKEVKMEIELSKTGVVEKTLSSTITLN